MPELVHKTDAGGVRVGLTTPVEVATAAVEMMDAITRALPDAHHAGFLVQRMVTGGRETIVGMSRPERLQQTLELAAIAIPDEMWARLDEYVGPPADPEAVRWRPATDA